MRLWKAARSSLREIGVYRTYQSMSRSRSSKYIPMAHLIIEGFGEYDVEDGTRLVLAIEQCGVDIGHRCGGNARCTTCRVRFIEGEPDTMTQAEYDKLNDRNLLGEARLSCQIVAAGTMHVEPLMRVEDMGWDDPGPAPDPTVQPRAEWRPKAELQQGEG